MNTHTRRASVVLFALLMSCALAAQTTVRLDPATTEVHYTVGTLLHTVHGTFHLTSGTVQFDPKTGAASGDLIIDANTGDSDNKSRDRKMKAEVLETNKYPYIRFIAQQVIGSVAPNGTSNIQLKGIFRIHGQDHELTMPVTVSPSGNTLAAHTDFKVPYVLWGMKNPSTFILSVNKIVDITIDAKGTLETHPLAARR